MPDIGSKWTHRFNRWAEDKPMIATVVGVCETIDGRMVRYTLNGSVPDAYWETPAPIFVRDYQQEA